MIDEKIKAAIKLHEQMNAEVSKYTELARLAYENEVQVVKHNVNYYFWNTYIQEAMDEFYVKNRKRKVALKKLTELIEKHITGKPIKIIGFAYMGLPKYGWNVEFKCGKTVYTFEVPSLEDITLENYCYANHCKLYLGYHYSESTVRFISASYDIEDIKKAFQERLTYETA